MLSINNKTNKLVIETASKLYNDKEKYNKYWKIKYNVKLNKDNECMESTILKFIKS
jgi:hypothetical protein